MTTIKYYKTINVPLKCSKSDYKYLQECNKISAQVWNLCIDLEHKHREENNGEWIEQNLLQTLTKKCVPLHAKGIQHVICKYIDARKAALKAKEVGRKDVLFPYKKKNHFVTGWDKQSIKIDTERGIIKLSRPEIHNNEGQKKRQKPVTCYVKTLPKDIVQVELIYRDKYYLCIKYIEEIEYLQINSENHAAIDLGEIHSITSIDSSSNAIIITGRLMRSIKRLRNKEQAKIRSRMTKCEKGSRQYKRYSKALRNIKAKTDRQIHDCIHKISKLYLDFCIHNNISIVYFGDLDGASRSTKQKRRGNKMVRQKLSQWNFGQMMKLLENKLIRYNIRVIKISEAYSSQKCPQCDKLNKPKGREYKCRRCNYQQHRDINGAINILNDNASTKILRYKKLKYLQIT